MRYISTKLHYLRQRFWNRCIHMKYHFLHRLLSMKIADRLLGRLLMEEIVKNSTRETGLSKIHFFIIKKYKYSSRGENQNATFRFFSNVHLQLLEHYYLNLCRVVLLILLNPDTENRALPSPTPSKPTSNIGSLG